jgi:hypothetical protein
MKVAASKRNKGVDDPPKKGKDKSRAGKPATSRNREESMAEAGEDEFQNPRTSGTTSLGGESQAADPNRGPGGVEGTRGDE